MYFLIYHRDNWYKWKFVWVTKIIVKQNEINNNVSYEV